MKHTWAVTMILVGIFLLAQVVGLFITRYYIPVEGPAPDLPMGIERPEFDEETSFIPLFILILVATAIAFVLARFRFEFVWKVWFFVSIVFCVTIALNAFVTPALSKFFGELFVVLGPISFRVSTAIAVIISLGFAFFKVFKRNLIIHNLGEIILYGGLAAIFVPIANVLSISILLILISIYDYIAVRKTEHMVKLAKFQTNIKIFAGVLVPYKDGSAILGGGDIGFPLLFAGVAMKTFGFKVLIISLFAALALLFLFWMAEKKKFYPAMPFISAGCFLGYAVLRLV